MEFRIRESYAIIDGKTYIDSKADRAAIRDVYGDEFYTHVLSLWDSVPEKMTPDEILAELKQEKLSSLADTFNQRVSGAFDTSQGYTMQFDTSDAIKMQGAIQLLEATGAAEGYLTQANDETVYHVPLDVMKAVLIEMMTAFAACHARKQELRKQITSAKSKEELDEIEISWPV
jgi:hypothetical protein